MLSAAMVFITIVLALSFGIFAGWVALAGILQAFNPASVAVLSRKPARAAVPVAMAAQASSS